MHVVFDANVFVSAFISTSGTPKQIIELWRAEAFELVISEPILAEIGRVMRYPKIRERHNLSEKALGQLLELLRKEAHVVDTLEQLSISHDEADNRYIECAISSGAEYLVTGDKKHLLPIGEYQGVRIITPAAFMALVKLDQ